MPYFITIDLFSLKHPSSDTGFPIVLCLLSGRICIHLCPVCLFKLSIHLICGLRLFRLCCPSLHSRILLFDLSTFSHKIWPENFYVILATPDETLSTLVLSVRYVCSIVFLLIPFWAWLNNFSDFVSLSDLLFLTFSFLCFRNRQY